MVSYDICGGIETSYNIDQGPLKTLKKKSTFREQCIAFSQVYHLCQWLENTCFLEISYKSFYTNKK